MGILLFIVGILLFIGLIIVHEFGHFIVARRNGVEVEEFGIFFPPRLYKHRTKNGWLFSINLIPLGGFVKLKGEHDSDTLPGSFGAASLWAKSKIMGAGVAMNLITGLILLTILAIIGMPNLLPNQFTVKSDTHVVRQAHTSVLVSQLLTDSPAAKAGIKTNDQIIAIGPAGHLTNTATAQSLETASKKYAGQTVTVVYKRNNVTHSVTLILHSRAVEAATVNSQHPEGYLGVGLNQQSNGFTIQRSTWSAPVVAVGLSVQITALTFQGLGHALGGLGSTLAGAATGNTTARQHGQTVASSQVSGPVGIFVILKDGSALGYQFMLLIIALISLTLAIMNILPIPALDGGRLWITLAARALRRPLTPRREEAINAAGFAFLMVIVVLVTLVDIHRFF
jgi:regulator of sigma E protease